MAGTSTRELLAQYAAILDELIARGVVRSRNAPAGDLAELLVATAYGGEFAANSQKSWDVASQDGRLLQVKCRLIDPAKPRGNFSLFRSWGFDACVFVLLDQHTYDVVLAVEVPTSSIRLIARESAWVNGFRVFVRAPLASSPGAIDVTEQVRAALDALP